MFNGICLAFNGKTSDDTVIFQYRPDIYQKCPQKGVPVFRHETPMYSICMFMHFSNYVIDMQMGSKVAVYCDTKVNSPTQEFNTNNALFAKLTCSATN